MDQKLLQEGMSALSAASTTLTGWCLGILGATVAGIGAGDFLRPGTSVRRIYLLFIPGWVFLGVSIWYGDKVMRRLGAAAFMKDQATLGTIAESMNSDYTAQRGWFECALLIFGLWLAIILVWWVVAKRPDIKLMKIVVVLIVAGLLASCTPHPHCDCTILPFKPDPPCFEQCVPKILSSASYSDLTTKYGLPHDIANRIINAREQGEANAPNWYAKVLDKSQRSKVDTIFRQKERPLHNLPNR